MYPGTIFKDKCDGTYDVKFDDGNRVQTLFALAVFALLGLRYLRRQTCTCTNSAATQRCSALPIRLLLLRLSLGCLKPPEACW